MTQALHRDGFAVLPFDPAVACWAAAADIACDRMLQDGPMLRHGGTWCVGVDALDNAPDGSVDGVSLAGAWRDLVPLPDHWHRAQLSVVFPGYPAQEPGDTDAAHAYRITRCAAHVDGLHGEGIPQRRNLREPHAFVLGLPLNTSAASPLVVWPGSHAIMRTAFAACYDGVPPDQWGDVDVAATYQEARRHVFATCPQVAVPALPGQVVILDRHLLHGVAPWDPAITDPCRKVAYFRPLGAVADWLSPSFRRAL
ncbi:hypothetical protein [Yoonia vestfoldensis]|uniref:hypothetical protein n=1 Tax=Yoonia vestfoldensis TaxID=245188 RepID=UPI0003738C38|nr:hypothetical protein [Yoonia vestfoldensis]